MSIPRMGHHNLEISCFRMGGHGLLLTLFLVLGVFGTGLSQTVLWQPLDSTNGIPPSQTGTPNQVVAQPQIFQAFTLDAGALKSTLAAAPSESKQAAAFSKTLITVPMPDGTVANFRFVEAPIMEPALAKKFPQIKTYLGQGVVDPQAVIRFDLTPAGFHGQVLSPGGTVYIDPSATGDTNVYASYYKRDYARATDDFHCLTDAGSSEQAGMSQIAVKEVVSGGNLRIYRLACAATAEYTTFFNGTVANALAGIVTAINRVDGIYESELAVRLVLVANNDQIVYTNAATDPYSNSVPATLLTQNQSNLDFVIGSANYDLGHVFGTGGGGLAGLSVVGTANKAWGETGMSTPIGDAFYVDYVAHEIGHQFGAHHTFNGTNSSCNGNRTGATAYEPGSGTTIMAYAGICGVDNVQPHSDPYFHSASVEEIINFTTSGIGNSCAVITNTLNNAPTVNAGAAYTIPKGTPFTLTASGSDPDGDPITYCWEERDLGPVTGLGSPDNGSSPIFRSFNPVTSASRTFPRLSDILNNTSAPGEMLPGTNRTMSFRVTARDNRIGGGGVNMAEMQVVVASNAGPFIITSPASRVTWSGAQTVTWNVAGTAGAPTGVANVNILLSTNGGVSFPITLAANTPNDGSEAVALPGIDTTNARIRVEAVGNIFFAISKTNFNIVPPTPQMALNSTALLLENCSATNGLIDPGETVTINFSLKNTGNAPTTNLIVTLLSTNGVMSPSSPQSYGAVPTGGSPVAQPFTFTAAGSCGGSLSAVLQLQDGAANLGTITVPFSLGAVVVVTQTFTNSANINIRDNTSALPYPSGIAISNLTGTVTKVTATLRGFTHTFPDDVDVMLVGPGGQKMLLMSDAGGGGPVTNLTLTLDDAAATSLPDSTVLSSGTNKPTNYDTNTDNFPAPAPGPPYVTNLAVFNGVNPNGTWSLYVQDDGPNDVGNFSQGWTLSITTSNLTCCTGEFVSSDLAIGESVSPGAVNVGSNLTYNVSVTNLGPSIATGVVVSDPLPAGLKFTSAVSSQGSCVTNNGLLTCSLGTLNSGGVATITMVGSGISPGILSNAVNVSTATTEFVTSNNTASAIATVNSFPTISAIGDQVTDQDIPTAPISFLVGDAETSAGSLAVSAISANTNLIPATNFVFGGSSGNRTVVITPAANQYGTTTVAVAVSDGMANSVSTFQLSVRAVNHRPMLGSVPAAFAVDEGSALTFTNAALDTDLPAQLLTFSLSNAPAGATINSSNGVFSWVPSEAQGPSTNQITIIVTDNGVPPLSDAKTFSVTVNEQNTAPVLSPAADQTVVEGHLLVISNTATDADIPANTLTFSLGTNSPSGAAINPTNGIFTWTPSEAQGPATNIITVMVTDDGIPPLSATQTFTVIVLESNLPPVLAPIADQTIVTGQIVTVTNFATDPDLPANQLTFSLGTNTPSGAQIDPVTGLFTWAASLAPGTNPVTVIVTDNGEPNLSAAQSFSIIVTQAMQERVLPPVPDQMVVETETLIVTNLFIDPTTQSNAPSFCLHAGAPAGAAVNATNGIFTWTPTEAQGPSTNAITICAVYPDTLTTNYATFMVTVLETNSPPSLAAITDRVIHAGCTLEITNVASDSDIPVNQLTFSLDPGAPSFASIDPTNGTLIVNTTAADAETTNLITVRVTDDGIPKLSDVKSFTLSIVSAPLLTRIVVTNGIAVASWSSIPAQKYRLQFADSFADTNWSDILPEVTATTPTACQTNAINGVDARFYRVLVVP
jgi:uncharacterized repeat protein (TIGR01451 family)